MSADRECGLKEIQPPRRLVGCDRRGIVEELASSIRADPKAIRALYNNDAKRPSIELLGGICDWLRQKVGQDSEVRFCYLA